MTNKFLGKHTSVKGFALSDITCEHFILLQELSLGKKGKTNWWNEIDK